MMITGVIETFAICNIQYVICIVCFGRDIHHIVLPGKTVYLTKKQTTYCNYNRQFLLNQTDLISIAQ